MEHFLHGQHNQNGLLAVLKLTAALLLHTIELFPLLSGELLSSLRSLSPADWARPTACAPWTVKDVAAHLLGGSIGRLWDDASRVLQPGGGAGGYSELVALINRDNEEWVRAARRISRGLLIDLLELTDRRLYEHFKALADEEPARVAVAWAGEARSANWFDIAREYTEKWLHQQHIREAVGHPLLTARQWLYPVLDTFLRGLPHLYRAVDAAAEGDTIAIRITGEAGGEWSLRREGIVWQLYIGWDPSAQSRVSVGQDVAWRLFTKGLNSDIATCEVQIEGDTALGARVLELVCPSWPKRAG
jgi:uncharacterized protein (TIGR03083 family)